MTSPITVAVIDEHAIVREGVTLHLNQAAGVYKVVGSGSSVKDVPRDPAPDIVLLDLMLKCGDFLDGIPTLVQRGSKVLVHTSEERPVPLRRAVGLGASGVILKGDPVKSLIEGISAALDGEFYVSGPMARALVTDLSLAVELSEQQRQVLECIDEGLDYRATARVMNISGNTVKEYLARIRDKYREHGHNPGNSHHLTRLAYEEGHLR